ncbi:mitochondrial import receptor subunit TOM20-like [Henckelia pumila]|uniref:mitochondrial import receptor subunit TOM20-like n=1 Tax=Henckelia pumila TaxID=405737 RepID=UPI003C6E2089
MWSWGEVLLELAQFHRDPESKKMVLDAIFKLEEALEVDPRKHDALWALGNGYTANAFLFPDPKEATPDKAAQCYEQAVQLVPELHVELNKNVYRPIGKWIRKIKEELS